MKTALTGLLVDWTQPRKESDLEDTSIESSKTEKKNEQRLKNKENTE